MSARFDPADGARLVSVARADRSLSQTDLAQAAGMRQPNVAAIESGRRSVSADALERLLGAADYRPSVALEERAGQIVDIGRRHGLRNIRVFGSTVNGTDHFTSDIDLLAKLDEDRSYFDIGAFVSEVEALTGFPVDVVIDNAQRPAFLAHTELVPL